MEGFTYGGIHSGKYGVWFVPDAQDRWFQSPDYEVFDEEVVGRDGGYWYGNRAKIRTFSLKCYFEDITIATREKIRQWLDRKTRGQLIFDQRPFVYYDVRPSKVVTGKIYPHSLPGFPGEFYSGTLTITFDCYEPYGILKYKAYTDVDEDGVRQYCGMVETSQMPAAPTASSTNWLMYNPGTEPCDTVLIIDGTAPNGVTVKNYTNGTYCKLNGLFHTGYLRIESDIGAVWHVTSGGNRELDYSLHDEGFLRLDPCTPIIDNLVVTTTEGSSTITLSGFTPDDTLVGKYVLVVSKWYKITAVDSDNNAITVDRNLDETNTRICMIATMNELGVEGNGFTLTALRMDYTPKIS